MPAPIQSIVETGDRGIAIDVECHMSNGLPNIIIVGFANKAVDEARERVRSAFASAKLELPRKRIIINLAPADIRKDSTGFDLAIAGAILTAGQQALPEALRQTPVFGELGLGGEVRPVRGIIGKLVAGKQLGYRQFIIPGSNLQQALLVPDITLLPVTHLKDLYLAFTSTIPLPHVRGGSAKLDLPRPAQVHDFADVVGQQRAKRALEIAAAGGHNTLLSGAPGTGKSMLAKALPSILPPLEQAEVLEVTHLHSLASQQYDKLVIERPFRAPHHSASEIAIIGGGGRPRPGEISLAHKGVLFLDELPEYGRLTLEALRQPLEDQTVTIARAHDSLTFPASFILVATANPCPCGYYGSSKACRCLPGQISHYANKLSGPIMDRIDLYVEVDEIQHATLLGRQPQTSENSATILERVLSARDRQRLRFRSSLRLNNSLTNPELKRLVRLAEPARQLLNTAAGQLSLSARAYMRTVKVAQTIADLCQCQEIEVPHISEALQYRRRLVDS